MDQTSPEPSPEGATYNSPGRESGVSSIKGTKSSRDDRNREYASATCIRNPVKRPSYAYQELGRVTVNRWPKSSPRRGTCQARVVVSAHFGKNAKDWPPRILARVKSVRHPPLSLEYSGELKYTVTNENGSNPEQHHFSHPNKSVPSETAFSKFF
jgi:hypothetical protein